MAQSSLEQALDILRDHHIRVTKQRKIILNYLITHRTHPSVETMFDDLRTEASDLSVATIYNTLNRFVEIGIVLELPNDHGGSHYDIFLTRHYHAICENCGKIVDISTPELPKIEQTLEQAAADQSGYLINNNHIEVYGLCPDCQRKLHVAELRHN